MSSADKAGSSGEPLPKVARRDADSDHDKFNSELNQTMLSKLECPVCLHPMQPPIYHCSTGHSFCNECEPQLQKCPICPAEKTKTRSFGMEGMTDDVIYPCRGSGCKESYLIAEKRNHSADCVGRVITCYLTACNFSGTAAKLMDHANQSKINHGFSNLKLDKFHVIKCELSRLETFSFLCGYMSCDDQLFKHVFSKYKDGYGFCVMLCGQKSTASRYQFVVKFNSAAAEKPRLTSTSTSDVHCDLDSSPGCCVSLFIKESPMERRVVERDETKRWLTLSFKIMRVP